VFAGVVLFLFGCWDVLGGFSVATCLLVDSHAFSSKWVFFLLSIVFGDTGFTFEVGWLDIVEGRSKVYVNISVDDAYGAVLVLWFDLKNVDLELLSENFDGYGIALVQTSEVS
jgi:hypothetical protein